MIHRGDMKAPELQKHSAGVRGPKGSSGVSEPGSGCGSEQHLQKLWEAREVFKEHYRNSAVPSYCIISRSYHNFT